MLDGMHWAAQWTILLIGLLALFAIGVPIGFAMGIVAVLALIDVAGFNYVLDIVPTLTYSKTTPYLFVALPLFILMTEFMAHGGISTRLVDVTQKLIGRLPGSLAMVTIVASTLFGAICGSAAIGAIAISDMLLPETMKRDYDKSLIAGAIAAGGTLSVIIPPSFTFILWGIIAEESIEALFLAGIIPGVLIAGLSMIYIMFVAKRNPALAPMPPSTTTKEKGMALIKGWDVALLILIVVGGVYSGFATLTEIAGVAAFAALIIVLLHRSLSGEGLFAALRRTASMTAFFLVLIVGAFLLIHATTVMRIPHEVTQWVIDAGLSTVLLVIAIQLMFFILGMFIDAGSVILISLPLFVPVLKTLDVDLVWFGVVIAISCMIANLTPPVGINLFIVQGVGRPYGISYGDVVKGTIPFIIIMLFSMILVIAFPAIATWLPDLVRN